MAFHRRVPAIIYRSGQPSPLNLKARPGEETVSFRDALSNPWPVRERPVFRPGDDDFGIDTSRLLPGSVIPDDDPPGHVSVLHVSAEVLKDAVVERRRFPK